MLNQDYREMLELLLGQRCRFLIVGAYALAAYGYPRATGDIDIWIAADRDNAAAVMNALEQFGAPTGQLSLDDLETPGTVFQIGVAPCRIDIITRIDGVEFNKAYGHRHEVVVEGLLLPFISKGDLITNKMSTGRLKDRADVEELENGS